MACKPTRFPNGILVGGCLELAPGTILPPTTENIVETSGPTYTMDGTEDIIFCTGAVDIEIVSISLATKSFIVNADGGTVMMLPDGSDTIQTAVITDGNSGKFGPKSSTSQWRDL